ncbi:MAG: saccharopine dehydrogenase NADP-binding domain-containing protein, partial [Bacteroidota bacterium]
MNKTTILLLGGYGGVGRTLATLLLQETEVLLIIAGRHKEQADAVAAKLNQQFPGTRVSSRYADASKPESLLTAFQEVQLVIVLITVPALVKQIAQAALAAGCDYMDILVSESTIRDLNELAPSITQQKRTVITQGGFHPGLPAVFVRYAAQFFDVYEKASIGMAMNARFERAEQAAEILPLITDFNAEICRSGSWRRATYKDTVQLDMGTRFGTKQLFPMPMVELKLVQKRYNLQETGVYVSGFNWFVDYLVMPLIFIMDKIKKGMATGILLKLFTWGVNSFSSPYQGVAFLNEAEGVKDGKRRKVRILAEHNDAYQFTAIPITACVKQYCDGTLSPGLQMMGHTVDEQKLFREMERMGVSIETEIV